MSEWICSFEICSANFSSTGRQSSLNIVSPTTQGSIFGYPSQPMTQMCLHGPARVEENKLSHSSNVDIVLAIRLLAWPSLAQSWISRERNQSWPSNAVVSEVQRNGCDLVYVSHRDYKHDKSNNLDIHSPELKSFWSETGLRFNS